MHYLEGEQPPAADGTGNQSFREVIGNRDDIVTTTTLAGRVHSTEEHVHSAAKLWPNLADGVDIVSTANPWELGALTEIIPAASIGLPFDIHFVHVESVSAMDVFQLNLYYGPTDIFCSAITLIKSAGLDPVLDRPDQTPIIPAGSRVRGRLATAGGAQTLRVKAQYHEYT